MDNTNIKFSTKYSVPINTVLYPWLNVIPIKFGSTCSPKLRLLYWRLYRVIWGENLAHNIRSFQNEFIYTDHDTNHHLRHKYAPPQYKFYNI